MPRINKIYFKNKISLNKKKNKHLEVKEVMYRKLLLSANGDTLKKPDGTLLVTAHRVF